MAEFCKCGSFMVNGNCTNKNCSNKPVTSSVSKVKKAAKSRTIKPAAQEKPATKNTKAPRASKVVTYHISELPLKEQPK